MDLGLRYLGWFKYGFNGLISSYLNIHFYAAKMKLYLLDRK